MEATESSTPPVAAGVPPVRPATALVRALFTAGAELEKSLQRELSVNPTGTVPTLIDGPVRLTESMAICERSPLVGSRVKATPADFGCTIFCTTTHISTLRCS